MRLCPCWTFILLPPPPRLAVRLACAICLDPPDGRLQQLRRDCTLCHAWAGICVRATQSAVCKTSAAYHSSTVTVTHNPHLHPAPLTHRPFIYSLTVNHSIQSAEGKFLCLITVVGVYSGKVSSRHAGWDVKVVDNGSEHFLIYRDYLEPKRQRTSFREWMIKLSVGVYKQATNYSKF